jgi:hypothetical protein
MTMKCLFVLSIYSLHKTCLLWLMIVVEENNVIESKQPKRVINSNVNLDLNLIRDLDLNFEPMAIWMIWLKKHIRTIVKKCIYNILYLYVYMHMYSHFKVILYSCIAHCVLLYHITHCVLLYHITHCVLLSYIKHCISILYNSLCFIVIFNKMYHCHIIIE